MTTRTPEDDAEETAGSALRGDLAVRGGEIGFFGKADPLTIDHDSATAWVGRSGAPSGGGSCTILIDGLPGSGSAAHRRLVVVFPVGSQDAPAVTVTAGQARP